MRRSLRNTALAILFAGAMLAVAVTVEAQQPKKVPRIGYLSNADAATDSARAVLNFLAFAIGGFIVGVKSAGRTILEPGISAAVAVLIALLISGNFTVVNLLAVGLGRSSPACLAAGSANVGRARSDLPAIMNGEEKRHGLAKTP